MLWICTRFPHLPLDAYGAWDSPRATAIVDRNRILLANPTALEAGLQTGLPESTAHALCADLECLPPAPEKEQQRLQQLALLAYQFTPHTSIGEDALHLEISTSLTLFHGQRRLYQQWQSQLLQRDIHFQAGLAHAPSAAHLLSQGSLNIDTALGWPVEEVQSRAIDALKALPIKTLPVTDKVLASMEAMGLRQLGQVLALPQRELSRRFGQDFGQLLAYLLGREAQHIAPYQPPDQFESVRHFNGGIDNREQLLLPMEQLLEDLQRYLRLKQLLARELRWLLIYSDGQRQQFSMPLSLGVFQPAPVHQLSRLHLDKQTLLGPLDSLFLECEHFDKLSTGSETLLGFESPESENRRVKENYAAVLDKLRARLERDQCQVFTLPDEHLPDEAATLRDPGRPSTPPTTSSDKDHRMRPLWLLAQPQALLERDNQLYHHGALELLQGPERFDLQWWSQRRSRDYYIARHPRGSVYWIYKDCLQQRWYLHGLFA